MSQVIPEEFWQSVEQFNQGDFYACHDTLEALWMEASEPEKKFYQGILQIAVSFYHLGNQNWQGAAILLGEGISRLRNYQPDYYTIDLEKLIVQSWEILLYLQQTGPENVAEVARQLLETNSDTSEGESDGLQVPKIVTLHDSDREYFGVITPNRD